MATGLLIKEENNKKHAFSLRTISQLSVAKRTVQECSQVMAKEFFFEASVKRKC